MRTYFSLIVISSESRFLGLEGERGSNERMRRLGEVVKKGGLGMCTVVEKGWGRGFILGKG